MDMHLSSMTKEELVARQKRLSITIADINMEGLDIEADEGLAEGNACESNLTLGTLSTSGGTSVTDTKGDRDSRGGGAAQPPKQVKGCLKRTGDILGEAEPPLEISRNYSGGGDACRSSGSVVSASSSKMHMIRSRSRERAQQLHDLAVAQEEQGRAAMNMSREYSKNTSYMSTSRRGSLASSSSQQPRGRSRMKPSAAKADARAKIHAARVRTKSRERDFAAAADATEAKAAADMVAAGSSSPRRRSGDGRRSSNKRAEEEIIVQQLQKQLDDQVRGRVSRRGSMASKASCGGSVVSMGDRSIRSTGSTGDMDKRVNDKLRPTVRRGRRSSLANGTNKAADPPGRRRSSLLQDTDSEDGGILSGDEVVIHGHRSSGHLSGLSSSAGGHSSGHLSGHLSRSSLPIFDIDMAQSDDKSTTAASVDGRVGRREARERRGGRRSSSVDGMRRIACLVDDDGAAPKERTRKRGNDLHSISTETIGNRFVDDLQQLVNEAKETRKQEIQKSSRRSSRSGVNVKEEFLSELNVAGDRKDDEAVVKKTRQPRRGSIQAAQQQLMGKDAKRYDVERPAQKSDKQLQISKEQKLRQPRRGSIQAAQKQMAEDDAKKYDVIREDRRRSSRSGSNDSNKRGRRRSRSSDRALDMLNKSMEGEQIEMDVVFDYREEPDDAKPIRRSNSRGECVAMSDMDSNSAKEQSMHRSRSRESLAALSRSFDERETIPRIRSRTVMDIALDSERSGQALERRSSDQRRRRSRSADRAADLADELAHDDMAEKAARRRSRSSERSGDIMAQVDHDSRRRDERRAERRRSRSMDQSSNIVEAIGADYRGRGDERRRIERRRSRSMDRSSDIAAQVDNEGRERRRSSRSSAGVDGLSSQIDLKPLPSKDKKDKRGRRKAAERPADITAHLAKLHAPQLAKLNRGLPKDRDSRRRSSDNVHVDNGGGNDDRYSRRSSDFVDDGGGNSDRYYNRRSRSRDRSQNLDRAIGELDHPSDATRERRRSRSADRSLDIQKIIEGCSEQDRRGQWLDAHPKTRDRNDGVRRRSSSVDRTRELSDLVDRDFAREVGGATILRGGSSCGGARASEYFTDPLYQLQMKEKKGLGKKITKALKGK